MSKPLWCPQDNDIDNSEMALFLNYIHHNYQQAFANYAEFHHWSVHNKAAFWEAVWTYCDIKASEQPTEIFIPGKTMRDASWFPNARLNFADNLLRRQDDHSAIHYAREDGLRQTLTFKDLNHKAYRLAAYLEAKGVRAHDHVAGFLPNCPDAIVAMLATTLLGAVWTSCSPDFGADGVCDRFGQIQPKILFICAEHYYNGNVFHHHKLIQTLQANIPSIKEIIRCDPNKPLPECDTFVTPTQLPFDHATYILYSSGTTGQPKCLVHGAGGTLIQHLKELKLHCNITEDDTLFFYTTCGWMMWNWMVSALALGATLVLYDGAPFAEETRLYDLIDEFDITHFGSGAKFFETSQQRDIRPISSHTLNSLKCILTTGSPLLPHSFDYIYTQVKTDVRVSSISGGSDIISCFALGNPMLPVYSGELQCTGLGMDVHIFNQHGESIIDEKGELVCTSAFPSRPVYFWNDASGEKYQHAYYDVFPNVWTHGDYAKRTKHGGLVIYGRSDATLNPSGVRIGTAEIYRQLEKIPEIVDAVAVGKEHDGSDTIWLFVVLQPSCDLTDALIQQIRQQIKSNTSPLHVPERVLQVPDLPRTQSGKTVELAVKAITNGYDVTNTSSLANPEIIDTLKELMSHIK